MSFDVFLTCNTLGAPRQSSGAAVLELLRSRRHRGPDEFGFYVVECNGAGAVEFSARGLSANEPLQSCAFHIRRFSPDVAQLVYDVARAAGMTIDAALDNDAVLTVEADLDPGTLKNQRILAVGSAAELTAVLRASFEKWAACGDFPRG